MGIEFVNKVSTKLHSLTGTEQRLTSAYHPQTNGLVDCQNRTIKDSLIKCLKDISNWVGCIPSVRFTYNTSKHFSTTYTPFEIMYGRIAVIPQQLTFESMSQNPE